MARYRKLSLRLSYFCLYFSTSFHFAESDELIGSPVPSDMPSLVPSSMPSDAPSLIPSSWANNPSMELAEDSSSDVPSDVPSDFPSMSWQEATRGPAPLNEEPAQPVIVPTFAPIPIPPQPDRFLPTPAPTGQRFNLTGEVYLELKDVIGEMTEAFAVEYNIVCTDYFRRVFSTITPPIVNVQATLLKQTFPADKSRKLRALQDLQPLRTLVQVTGLTESERLLAEANAVIFLAATQDPAAFVRGLRNVEGPAVLYFNSVQTMTPRRITSAPSPPPSEGGGDGGGGDSSDRLSRDAIGGIIVGAIAWSVIVAALVYYTTKPGEAAALGRAGLDSSRHSTTPLQPATTAVAASTATTSATSSMKKPNETKSLTQSVKKPEPIATSAVVVASAPPESVASPLEPEPEPNTENSIMHEEDITVQGAASAMNDSEYGADNVSYAYSLDPGNVDTQAGGTSAPSGPGTGTGDSTVDDQTTDFSARPNLISRTVIAPPGKLGIVIDTTLEGPVVHKVNPGSPLEGHVYPGDIIVAIDDVDTRAMSATAITSLMVKTANQERRLTVLSEDGEGEDSTQG